jgi:flavin-binding protein dodecin
MPDKTYKIIEVVGVSDESIHLAVRNASYYQKLWIDDVMKKAAYPSA